MDELQTLLEQIRLDRGLDLSSYKPSFLRRRLAVRLRARECPDYATYGRLLRSDPDEYPPLLEALTISLTRFFRDATTFQAIEEQVLPQLLQSRSRERHLRIWSAGCAAGEEPYSLAIILRETLGPALRRWRVEILGSDADGKALERAREGLYDQFSFEQLAPRYREWIEQYVTPGPQRQLDAQIRTMASFRQHNLLRDAAPENVDLLLCRNVLIYFDRKQQERLYHAFHQALREGGFLVLGKTEILPMAWSQRFPTANPREHIYRRAEPDEELLSPTQARSGPGVPLGRRPNE